MTLTLPEFIFPPSGQSFTLITFWLISTYDLHVLTIFKGFFEMLFTARWLQSDGEVKHRE